jgi:hypothetical protein
MGRMSPLWALLVFAGMGGGACAHAGTDPNTADISGSWRYIESFSDVPHGISCTDTGTYYLVQTGTRFTGVYTQSGLCRRPQGPINNADSGSVTDGRMTGRTLRFAAPNCAYDGALNADTFDRIMGHVACTLRDTTNAITFNFTGSWQAER